MEINVEVANQIVSFIFEQTSFHSIVCDRNGTIIADSAGTRIGVVHNGSKTILTTDAKEYAVTGEEAEASGGKMKEGYNKAILFEGQKVGTFGITGALEKVQPVANIASGLILKLIFEDGLKKQVLNCAQTVMKAIAQSADLITNINAASQELAATSQIVVEETRDAARQVEDTANILSFIRRVSDQTKLLGLNAAIEAARAGEHGRGFTVVAGEIRKLAEESNKSAAEINKMLQHFKNAIISMGEDIEKNSVSCQEQAKSTSEMAEVVNVLQQVGQELERLSANL